MSAGHPTRRISFKLKNSRLLFSGAGRVTKSTFTDWKNGRSEPKLEKLKKIADYFGVSIEYFLEEEKEVV